MIMENNLENMVIPQHVALILDGNGRWAKKRGLPRTMGHKEGGRDRGQDGDPLSYSIRILHGELEALRRRSGRAYAAVPFLYGKAFEDRESQ